MASNSNFSLVIVGIASFIGGVATGLLIAPSSGKEARQWIKGQASDTAKWVDKTGHIAVEKAEKKLESIKSGLKVEVEKNIPDLYKATEDLHLNEEELS